ncbi:MAG: glycosyltransferase [Rikenellaceae bacterium]
MISIIIPVYNVEKLLPKCLDSILGQSFADFEVILVNDGSKDGSGGVCDEYAARDNRIRVIHKINGGVSSARNIGLDEAQGEYICFVDSDDWLDESFLSDFGINEYCADLYISGALYDIDDKVYSHKTYQATFVNGAEAIGVEFSRQGMWSNGYPWGKLYRRDIIQKQNLRFNDKLNIHEDHLFLFEYQTHVRSVRITDTSGYHYLVIDGSTRKLSSKTNSYKELILASEAFDDVLLVIKKHLKLTQREYESLYNSFVINCRIRALLSIFRHKNSYDDYKIEILYWKGKKELKHTDSMGKFIELVIIIMTTIKPIWLGYSLLKVLFFIKSICAKEQMASIYADLDRRSERYDG